MVFILDHIGYYTLLVLDKGLYNTNDYYYGALAIDSLWAKGGSIRTLRLGKGGGRAAPRVPEKSAVGRGRLQRACLAERAARRGRAPRKDQ